MDAFAIWGRINPACRPVLYAPKVPHGALGCGFSCEGAYKLLDIAEFICPNVKKEGVFFMFYVYWCFMEDI